MESLLALLNAGETCPDEADHAHLHAVLLQRAAARREPPHAARSHGHDDLLRAATAQACLHAAVEGRQGSQASAAAGSSSLSALVSGLGPSLHRLSQLCATPGAGAFLHLAAPSPWQQGGAATPPQPRRLPWMHVPPQAWLQSGARLAGVATKSAVFETVAAAGERLSAVALLAAATPASTDTVLREWRVFVGTAGWAAHVLEPAAASVLLGTHASRAPATKPPAAAAADEGLEEAAGTQPTPPVAAAGEPSADGVDGGGGMADGGVAPASGAATSAVLHLKPSLFQRAMRNVGKTAAVAVARTVNAAATAAVVASEGGLSVSQSVTATFKAALASADAAASAVGAAGAGAPPPPPQHHPHLYGMPMVVPLSLALPVPVSAAELQRYGAALVRLHDVIERILVWLGDVALGASLLGAMERAQARAPSTAWVDLRGTAAPPQPSELLCLLGSSPVGATVQAEARWLLHCARLWRQAGASLHPLVAASCGHALVRAAVPLLLGDVRALTERYVHKMCDALRRAEAVD